MTATTSKLLTYDDWLAMPEVNTFQEIIEGSLIESLSPGWNHATVLQNLYRIFDTVARETDAGEVRPAVFGIRLSLHNVLEPDLFFIQKDRLGDLVTQACVDGPPDLTLEVVSPTSVKMDTLTKFDLYARYGVAEYWIVNPMTRTISVHTLVGDRYEPLPPDAAGLHRSRVLPGLAVDPAPCFAGMLGANEA